jgi:RNA polymerase-interacting CarD/CdnL/TRCF family regulator
MSKTREIVVGSLLYHAVHGVCRVEKIEKRKHLGKSVLSYSLAPAKYDNMQSRFSVSDIEGSGFHAIITMAEAKKILKYLTTRNSKVIPQDVLAKEGSSLIHQNKTWGLAQAIVSYEKQEIKSRIKREVLDRSARGLVRELAFVFNSSLKVSANRVQKSLESKSKVHPLVLEALEQAAER